MIDRRSRTPSIAVEAALESYGIVRAHPDMLDGDERTLLWRVTSKPTSPPSSRRSSSIRAVPSPICATEGCICACAIESVEEENLLGLIEIPPSLNRVIEMPHAVGEYRYILLEDVILACFDSCFGSYTPLDRAVIRVTRNADIDPDGEGVEEDEDYRMHMKRILKKRLRLQPVALSVSGDLAPSTLKTIRKSLWPQIALGSARWTPRLTWAMSLVSKAMCRRMRARALSFPPFEPGGRTPISTPPVPCASRFSRAISSSRTPIRP